MRISARTDYAIRVLVELGADTERRHAKKLRNHDVYAMREIRLLFEPCRREP